MLYFLLFISAALILNGVVGLQKERDWERQQFFAEPISDVMPSAKSFKEEDEEIIKDLTDRMAEMERSLFDHLLKWQMEKEELLEKMSREPGPMVEAIVEVEKEDEVVEVIEPKRKPMPDHIRKVMEYEKEGLSIQEIANVTKMNKGEVLLLRNLSKHYEK